MNQDIDELLAQMTVEEKCALLCGSDFWHTAGCARLDVPAKMLTDGPCGLRKQYADADNLGINDSIPSVAFPTPATLACSFDVDLAREVGRAVGQECRAEDVAVILGPAVNIKRSPLCGRNFEYLSEDPVLAGRLGAAWIEGVQSMGVGTSVKHFAGNSQEKNRMTSDSLIDERALREIYLRPFEICVKDAHPWTVMAAYNRIRGVHCSENRKLLTDILRDEWGFDGVVVTDWGALNRTGESIAAGLDLVMPGPRADVGEAIRNGMADGSIAPDVLDKAARRMLELIAKSESHAGAMRDDGPAAACSGAPGSADGRAHDDGHPGPRTRADESIPGYDAAAHLALAARAASESAVLLENDGTLPLLGHEDVAIIGSFAKQPRFQGSGSSKIHPIALDCLYDALDADGMGIRYAEGYDVRSGQATDAQLEEAVACAAAADVAIVLVGLPASYESEGFDRTDLDIPASHVELVERVCAANPRTVVLLLGGAPFLLPWKARPAALLLAYLTGCQGGRALADILLGRVYPSGKLAETWPRALEDTPCGRAYPDPEREVLYRESIYVGYRFYDAVGLDVAYPFGYGLSYTTFSLEGLCVEARAATDDRLPARPAVGKIDLDETNLIVRCTVANTGSRAGAEVVQLYLAPVDPGVFKAPRSLEAFAKVFLEPGQRRTVEFGLDRRSFSHYDTARDGWAVEAGAYRVLLGTSSRDLVLEQAVEVEGDERRPCDPALACYEHPTLARFDDASFAALYEEPLPLPRPRKPFTLDTRLGDLRGSLIGNILVALLVRTASVVTDDEEVTAMMTAMALEMPIRSLAMAGSIDLAYGVLDAVSGHPVRGMRMILDNLPKKA